MNDILDRLAAQLELRKTADPASSYVAKLYAKGLDAILKKIGEEATETVMAAKDGNADKIIYEVADLWFHTLVLLAQPGIATRAGAGRIRTAFWVIWFRRKSQPQRLKKQ